VTAIEGPHTPAVDASSGAPVLWVLVLGGAVLLLRLRPRHFADQVE
jgi:hypothetical protein